MLPRIKLIQIGDLHLPSAALSLGQIDDKDPKFPPSLKTIISQNPIKTVFRRLHELLEKGSVSAILFMGDLTDYGSIDGYKSAAQYIASALDLDRPRADCFVGIVPGNHDVNRDLARSPGGAAKFAPLQQVLNDAHLPVLPIQIPTVTSITAQSVSASILLTNSCWGCGEVEYIPEVFRSRIVRAINSSIDKGKSKGAEKVYYDRQLDTPAFSYETIEFILSSIADIPRTALPIIVAHHNILPQRTPRLAPFTELINGGALRGSLLDSSRPTLFLHGHIHTDPIEIVQSPSGGLIVSISAPAASLGFNVIEIIYTPTSMPLSCRVTPYRFDDSGVLKSSLPINICLLGPHRRAPGQALALTYAKLIERRECYWDQIVEICTLNKTADSDDIIEEMLELLLADGSIAIANYDLPRKNWLVSAEI